MTDEPRSYGEAAATIGDEQRAYRVRAIRADAGHGLVALHEMELGALLHPEADPERTLWRNEAVTLAIDLLAAAERIEAGDLDDA
jgi:hypothetical protein